MSLSYQSALRGPVLAVKQERLAIKKWQNEGDRDALELLVRSHERQAWSQAANWTRNPTHLEDLVVEGIIGIMQAADKFDLKFKVRFSTYAMWWVSACISAAISRVKVVIDVPSRVYHDARSGKLNVEDSFYVQMAVTGEVCIDTEAQNSGYNLPSALRCSDMNPEESIIEKSSTKKLSEVLSDALEKLNPIERKLIKRLKLQHTPDCVAQLADELKITQTKLRQLEKHALMRLRRELPRCGFSYEMLD